MKKRRSLTLLEIMIVIVLIGLIGSVIGFNVKGSLDEGKAFKTRQAQEQIQNILTLEVARGASVDEVLQDKEAVLKDSGLVKDVKNILKDGWGHEFVITAKGRNHDQISVVSEKLKSYERSKKGRRGHAADSTEEDEDDGF